jgi:hypothetical protein
VKRYRKLPHEERRLLLLNDMPSILRRTAFAINAKLGIVAGGSLMVAYDIGVLAKTAHNDEATYGSCCLVELAEYLGIEGGAVTLYELGRLTTAFSREFLKQQVSIPMADGRYLQLAHFLLLANVHIIDKRMQVLDLIRKECLSPAATRKTMLAAGYLDSRTHGRCNRTSRGLEVFSPDFGEAVEKSTR